jgi:hypothetical protein
MLADQSAGPVLTSGFLSGVEYYDNIQSRAGVSRHALRAVKPIQYVIFKKSLTRLN